MRKFIIEIKEENELFTIWDKLHLTLDKERALKLKKEIEIYLSEEAELNEGNNKK